MAAFTKSTSGGHVQPGVDRLLVVSGAYTATASAEFSVEPGCSVVDVIINATAEVATAQVTPTLEAYNPGSDTWEVLLSGLEIAAVGSVTLSLNPYVAAVANLSVPRVPRDRMRVTMTHLDADALTYSIVVAAA